MLWDIERAASAIDQFVAGIDSAAYAHSDIIHAAVERKFEIIGEALSNLAKASPEIANRIPKFRKSSPFETCSFTATLQSSMTACGASHWAPCQRCGKRSRNYWRSMNSLERSFTWNDVE